MTPPCTEAGRPALSNARLCHPVAGFLKSSLGSLVGEADAVAVQQEHGVAQAVEHCAQIALLGLEVFEPMPHLVTEILEGVREHAELTGGLRDRRRPGVRRPSPALPA